MKISARNILKGTIKEISPGSVNSNLVLDVNGTEIAAQITTASVNELQLAVGKTAYAIVKIDNVIIGVDE
jgi:molybdopterin-binding protein